MLNCRSGATGTIQSCAARPSDCVRGNPDLKLSLVENILRQLPCIVSVFVDAHDHRHAFFPVVVGLLLRQVRQWVLRGSF